MAFLQVRHIDNCACPFYGNHILNAKLQKFDSMQVESLSKDDLASRLTLTADVALVGPILIPDSSITIMDVSL